MNNSKTLRQEKAISIWKDNNCKGTFQHIMRFGKTREIEMVISRTRVNHPDKRIVLLVPTDIAYQNVKHISKSNNVECYTLFTFTNMFNEPTFNREMFLLIIDEIHKFITPKNVNLLKALKASYKLGLTGSNLSIEDKKILKDINFPVIDVISEEEAIYRKWITEFDEYNVAIQLSESDKIRYKDMNDNIDKIVENFKLVYKKVNTLFGKPIFSSDFELLNSMYCGKPILNSNFQRVGFITPNQLRLIVADIMGYKKDGVITNDYTRKLQIYYNPNNLEQLAKTYNKCVVNRNNFLKHNVNKVNAIIELSKLYPRPTIVYNDSIDMIEQLYDSLTIPRVKYHSQIESCHLLDEKGDVILYKSGENKGTPKLFGKTTLKKLAIDSIINGDALYLITGRSLNESLNLPNIEYIICTSGDTNPNTYDQRVARGKTIDSNNLNKKCTIINLFIDDFFLYDTFVRSRDKEKLQLRQTNVKNVVWLENLDDLVCITKNNA